MEFTTSLVNDVECAKQGDAAAFERLIKQTQGMVSSIALAIVKDFDESEDIAQQVFIATWGNLNSLKNNHSFLPWIRQTTRYTAFNAIRTKKTTVNNSDDESEQLLLKLCNGELMHDEKLVIQEQNKLLNLFLDKLPDDSRDVVLLYYREVQSAQHVAQLLDISTDNVRQKLSRARRILKQGLLSSFGKVIFSTAPSAAFTAIVMASVSHSTPAAAATTAHIVTTGKSGFYSKLAALFSGAMLGASLGALATYFSTKPALKRMKTNLDKQQLIKHRNQTMTWIVFSGLLLALAYEYGSTTSIISTYLIFAIGLYYFNKRISIHIITSLYSAPNLSAKEAKRKRFEQKCGNWGLIIGVSTGFIALIIGLINNGQLTF